MTSRPPAGLMAAAVLLLAACAGEPALENEAPRPEPDRSAAPAPASVDETAAAAADKTPGPEASGLLSEENQRVILLFYPSEDGETLIPEERIIFRTNTLSSQVKQAVSELLLGPQDEGPVPAFSRNTRLLAVFLLPDGTALIDLGTEARAIPSGSASEIAAIYSLVNTVVFNFAEIERVQILVEGQEVTTLAGHVSTGRALAADLERIDWTWMPEAEGMAPWTPPAPGAAAPAKPAPEGASSPEPV